MTNRSKVVGEVFAGLDVSAREISVARGQGIQGNEEKPVVASFANNASGHKALLAYLLQGTERVRVWLEASGNYSLDLALALHAHRQVEVSLVNPRRARRFAESWMSGARPIPSMPACFANMPRACLWVAY